MREIESHVHFKKEGKSIFIASFFTFSFISLGINFNQTLLIKLTTMRHSISAKATYKTEWQFITLLVKS